MDFGKFFSFGATFSAVSVIATIVFVAVFVVIIIAVVNSFSKKEDVSSMAHSTQHTVNKENTICEYCGSVVDANSNKCSACGAEVNKK